MIHLPKDSPLNTANELTYECSKCGYKGKINMYISDTEAWAREYGNDPIPCPNCGQELSLS